MHIYTYQIPIHLHLLHTHTHTHKHTHTQTPAQYTSKSTIHIPCYPNFELVLHSHPHGIPMVINSCNYIARVSHQVLSHVIPILMIPKTAIKIRFNYALGSGHTHNNKPIAVTSYNYFIILYHLYPTYTFFTCW